MPRKKQGPPKRWRTKEAREIAETVQKAGGDVELTGKGHLKITGPDGTAIVASAPDTGRQGGRALVNTLATIQRETGLRVASDPAENRAADNTKNLPGDRPRPTRARQDRHGEITRWMPGDTYGFVTSDDGQSWFVSRDSLPDGLRELPEGAQVTFSGSPTPKAGKPYPEALRVRVAGQQGGTASGAANTVSDKMADTGQQHCPVSAIRVNWVLVVDTFPRRQAASPSRPSCRFRGGASCCGGSVQSDTALVDMGQRLAGYNDAIRSGVRKTRVLNAFTLVGIAAAIAGSFIFPPAGLARGFIALGGFTADHMLGMMPARRVVAIPIGSKPSGQACRQCPVTAIMSFGTWEVTGARSALL